MRDNTYIPLDERPKATLRTAILARQSDPSAKPEDMKDQVRQCQEFIEKVG